MLLHCWFQAQTEIMLGSQATNHIKLSCRLSVLPLVLLVRSLNYLLEKKMRMPDHVTPEREREMLTSILTSRWQNLSHIQFYGHKHRYRLWEAIVKGSIPSGEVKIFQLDDIYPVKALIDKINLAT